MSSYLLLVETGDGCLTRSMFGSFKSAHASPLTSCLMFNVTLTSCFMLKPCFCVEVPEHPEEQWTVGGAMILLYCSRTESLWTKQTVNLTNFTHDEPMDPKLSFVVSLKRVN